MKEEPQQSILPERVVKKPTPQKISLVPDGFQLAISAPQAQEEREEVYAGRKGSFSSSMDRVNNIDKEFNRERQTRTNALVAASGSALAVAFELDPLEEYRKQTGLVAEREQLMTELHKSYSLERGLRLLNLAVGQDKYHSMEDVNVDFPNITKYEMLIFSLLRKFPRLYLETGCEPTQQPTSDKEIEQSSIPNIIGATIDGLQLASDIEDTRRTEQSDAYHNLGITGIQEKRSTFEFADFSDAVKKNLRKSIPLTVKSHRLFERVWERFDVALQDGFRKADIKAAEDILGATLAPGTTLDDINHLLDDNQRKAWEQQKGDCDTKIAKCIVINPINQQVLRPQDIVKLTGLLKEFPDILVGEEPFEGYFIPMGTGVLFVDNTTQKRHYYTMYPYYIREALQGIQQEAIDPTRYNQVLNAIFHDVSSSIRAKVLAEIEETGEDPSLIEGKYIDLKIRYGIDIDPNSSFNIQETNWMDSWRSRTGQRRVLDIGLKFGADELDGISNVLRLVPDQMLGGVKRIRKELTLDLDLKDFLNGTTELGHYNKPTKTISLNQIERKPYSSLTPEEKALYSFTLLHEIAHGTWSVVDDGLQEEWNALSTAQGLNETQNTEDFLTWYSKSSPEEDFSECVAAYVLHGQDFRDAAEKNPAIAEKYQFIKRVFRDFAGFDREYQQVSPFSLDHLHKYEEEELKRHNFEEAVEEFAKRDAEEEVKIKDKTEKIAPSLDRQGATDIINVKATVDTLATDRGAANVEDQLGYKRTMVSELRDYFAEDLSEEDAASSARHLYALIEEGDVETAIRFARHNLDEMYHDEVEELIDKIKEDIEIGNNFSGYNSIYR